MNYKAVFKVLWKSVRDAFRGRGWKFFTGSFGAFVATLLFGKNLFNTSVLTSVLIGTGVLAGLFVVRFLLFLFRNSLMHLQHIYKESKYGEAIILLKNAFAKVHYYRKDEEQSDELFMKTMVELCNGVKEIFVMKNMCDCSVSIKVPIKGELAEGTRVINLARDKEHTDKRDTESYKKANHTIIGNTAFTKVLNKTLSPLTKNNAYINNNISGTQGYDNTSRSLYEDGKLPYESEIVVPIIPIEPYRGKEFKALGFLCVDCVSKNKFDEKYDVALMEGVADGIYDVLSTRAK